MPPSNRGRGLLLVVLLSPAAFATAAATAAGVHQHERSVRVKIGFTLAGAVNQFGNSERLAIKKLIFRDFTHRAVTTTLTIDPVPMSTDVEKNYPFYALVTAAIVVPPAIAVGSTMATLLDGVLATASSLEGAIRDQFRAEGLTNASFYVEAIDDDPVVQIVRKRYA